MITKEEVKKIAKLARIGITKTEEGKFTKDISSVLGYFDKLKKVDTSKIEPTTHSILLENIKRADEANNQAEKTKENLIKSAPNSENNYIKVKSIF
jgi:aspartyl-tRNA(Asn)/glutamyl-tRNA(Gln) amidotransferase subunit C